MSLNQHRWDIYKDSSGAYRWRRVCPDGNIVGSASEGFKLRRDCIENARRHGKDGNPDRLGETDNWEIYKDARGRFRWRRYVKGGRVVGASKFGFIAREACEANAVLNGMAL